MIYIIHNHNLLIIYNYIISKKYDIMMEQAKTFKHDKCWPPKGKLLDIATKQNQTN